MSPYWPVAFGSVLWRAQKFFQSVSSGTQAAALCGCLVSHLPLYPLAKIESFGFHLSA